MAGGEKTMSLEEPRAEAPTEEAAAELVAQTDTGARNPAGALGKVILCIAFIWAVFQLYIASNLPFWLAEHTGVRWAIVTNSDARRIHFAFALVLAAMAFPMFKTSPRDRIPWYDWLLIALSLVVALHAVVFRNAIADRAGLPTTDDLVVSSLGMLILASAVYRSLGLPLMIVGTVFVCYVFFGDARWLPEVMQWKGASFGKATWHFWMQGEGVFGVALSVSTSLIFLFVLFGAILEKAGAGNYFIKIAFALLGHLRGGPAKAAVVANVVTTGTFTIPLMKRTGFSPEKAGAVEVASSTNGQLTPPVMGAAAFLIAEFTGVPYTEIIKIALVPALVSYIALVYIVQMGLKGLPKPPATMTLAKKLIGVLTGFIGIVALATIVKFGMGWIKVAMPDQAFLIVSIGVAAAYIFLLWLASKQAP
jgi:TRAP transporter 4TM/12TM fusion protein